MLHALYRAAPIAVLLGCSGTTSSTGTIATTLVTVRPELFMGSVRCRSGELRSYVVTLTDVSSSPPVVLPSSTGLFAGSLAPVPCTQPVYFGVPRITAGVDYTGRIDGYDRDDLAAQSAGSPNLYAPAGEPVLPRWTTTCGSAGWGDDAGADADAADATMRLVFGKPTRVFDGVAVELAGCIPFATSEDGGGPDVSDAEDAEDTSDAEDASDGAEQ